LIVSLVNQKGGVGKTTLALHIAARAATTGNRVLLIDADPQHSVIDWTAQREAGGATATFTAVALPKKKVHADVLRMAPDYDLVVVDAPPRSDETCASVCIASDLVLMPVQPSALDIWASGEVVEAVEKARIVRPEIKAAFVVNRKIVNTTIGRDALEALAGFEGIPVLSTHIHQRVSFATSVAAGKTVDETDPGGLAAVEINALVEMIGETLNG
jgi:chromosome partitioning protein